MWTIIIFAILFAVILGISGYEDHYLGGAIISGFLGVIIGAFIGFMISIALPAKMEVEKTTVNIVSLKDNNSVTGHFFLGSGSINGNMNYTFYYESGKNSIKLAIVDCNQTTIIHTKEIPKAEQYQTVKKKGAFINNFAIDIEIEPINYIIYIPEGTIKQDFILDAE